MELVVLCGKVDRKLDQKVAAMPVLTSEAAPLDAKLLTRCRTLRNGQHHRSFRRRDLYLRAEHGLLEGDRQGQANILSLAGIKGMRGDLDGDDRVAASARPFL